MENANLIYLAVWTWETAEAFENAQKWAKASAMPMVEQKAPVTSMPSTCGKD